MSWSWDGATLDVQMGFGSPPATAIASITWTTITNYVRSLSFNYGKSDDQDAYQAGRLSMVLANADRRFDPLYNDPPNSPYFGNLKPMTPVRLRHTYGGTTVTLWTGFVSGFPQSYDPPYDATVNVTAADGFGVLQRTRLPSLYAFEVAADSPLLWWRLGEQTGTSVVDASGNGHDGTYTGGATFNSVAGLITDSDTAIGFDGTDEATGIYVWPSTPFSVEMWFKADVTANPTSPHALLYVYGSSFAQTVRVIVTDALQVFFGDGTNSASAFTATTHQYFDSTTHHLVGVFGTGTAVPKIYIDGVDVTSSGSTFPAGPVAPGAANIHLPLANGALEPFASVIDEFAIYGSALSAARALVHYNAGHNPFDGLDTGAAVTKILDLIGWPAADRTIETGKSVVSQFDTSGMTALDAIKALEATEQGRFFMAPDGKATFYNRHHTLITAASTTSQATFGDSGGELPYGDLQLDYDDSKIRNSVTTARVNGSPNLVKDTSSITSYREREFSLTGLLNSSAVELRDMGQWLLSHYAQPSTRVPSIVVQPRARPASLFPQIRDRLLCDRVTVKRRPQGVGAPISIDVLIEGIQHMVTPDDWTTTLLLSPAETVGYFRLDDPVYGLLDNNRLAF